MSENPAPNSPAGMATVDEADLARRARSDPDAFGVLYDRYVQPVYRYLADYLGDSQAARDAAASTFLAVQAGLAGFPPGERFAAWLFAIARSRAAEQSARQKVQAGAVLEGSQLGAAARELGEGEKELLRLRYAARLSPSDMAALLGCSPAAVRKLLERLLVRLYRRLAGGQQPAQPSLIHIIENELRSAYQAHQADPAYVDGLRQHLLSGGPGTAGTRSPASLGWVAGVMLLAALALLVALAGTLIIGPHRVWSAAMGWMGYQPQGARVESVPGLRVVLPAEMQREGVRVAVIQGLASLEQVTLVYQVDGLLPEQRPSDGQEPVCDQSPLLGLPGGGLLPLTGEDGNGWSTGYQMRVVFPPVPPDVDLVNLLLPCLDGARLGGAPENWSIPLRLEPAPPGAQIPPELQPPAFQPSATMPAGEPVGGQPQDETIPTLEQAGASKQAGASDEAAAVSEVSGVRFAVEQVIAGPKGYLIQGSLSWQGTGWDTVGFDPYLLTLADANGQLVPIEPTEPDISGYDPAGQRLPWAVLTAGKDFAEPLTLRLPAVEGLQVVTGASFSLDLGSKPQAGQTWPVDLLVEAAGQPVNILSAELSQASDGAYWLDFKAQVDPRRVAGLTLQDADNHSAYSGGQGGSDGMGLHTQGFSYDYLPEGVRRIEITSIALVIEGGWAVSVNLPE